MKRKPSNSDRLFGYTAGCLGIPLAVVVMILIAWGLESLGVGMRWVMQSVVLNPCCLCPVLVFGLGSVAVMWRYQRRAAAWRKANMHRWLMCPECGYNLRASKDRCPECGTPIPPQQ